MDESLLTFRQNAEMGGLADLVNPPRRKALTARGRKTIENRIARLLAQVEAMSRTSALHDDAPEDTYA